MANEPLSARSRRLKLTEKFRDKRYRDGYVSAHNRRFLAQQLRALRGDLSQEEFGKLIEKPQSVVSRQEDPAYGRFNLDSLQETVAKLDRAVFTRIVDFPTYLRLTEDMSESAVCPPAYDAAALDSFALAEAGSLTFQGSAGGDDELSAPPQTATENLVAVPKVPTDDEHPQAMIHG